MAKSKVKIKIRNGINFDFKTNIYQVSFTNISTTNLIIVSMCGYQTIKFQCQKTFFFQIVTELTM